jgi:L-2,4-diaminobutyrate decarboxylase
VAEPYLDGLRLPETMHRPEPEDWKLALEVSEWAMERLTDRRSTFPPRRWPDQLPPIQAEGVGAVAAWDILRDDVLSTALPSDHPRYLAFVPGAPTVAGVLADMAVSAAGIYAGSALEGGAVVVAERAALRWLADLAGLPDTAHGTFVSGGSTANLSALVAARHAVKARTGRQPSTILVGAGAHSSISAAADVMGCSVVFAGDIDGRFDGTALRTALAGVDRDDIVAVAATGGTTNTGAIDDLASLADVCREHQLWLHADAAYGGAALLSERCRHRFAGIEQVDSLTIDPHKWLFTPFDCAAVIYRDAAVARRAHAQRAPYLDAVNGDEEDNPADYATHLSRRARGIPLWMSLVANGTDAYTQAVDACLDLAEYAADRIEAGEQFELACPPSLSVVVFRRRGWVRADYERWSAAARRSGLGLVTPTSVSGAPALRFCFVNPATTIMDIDLLLDSLSRHR